MNSQISNLTISLAIISTCFSGCGHAETSAIHSDASPVPRTNSVLEPSVIRGPLHFTDMLMTSRIDFIHVSGDSSDKPFPAANGSGVAAFDYDLDGQIDVLFLTGVPFPIDDQQTKSVNRCYRNLGEWRFDDVTAQTRLGHNGYSAGVAVGDFNSDGFPDAYITCYGRNQLFRNLGDGTFEEQGHHAGVDDDGWGTSAAFLDYDNDGCLDLYVCNYAIWTPKTNHYCGDTARGVRIFCNPTTVEPARHRLFRSEGDGHFQEAFDDSGLASVAPGRGQGVVAADLNEDGQIDLYVGNDLQPNYLFLNRGGGKFENASELSGTARDHLGRNQASMGVDAADVNRDGRFELFVTNYEGEHNAFYQNMGSAQFQEVSHSRGLAADSLPYIGWGTVFADFDLDGWPDVIVTNGHTDNNLNDLGRDGKYLQPAGLWRNTASRFTFCGGAAAGDYFANTHVGRGLALADLDNDGDPDVLIAHKDLPPALLRNDALSSVPASSPKTSRKSNQRWIRVRLIGTRSNRDAVGAKVVLQSGDARVAQQIKGGGSYLSAHDSRLLFALPTDLSDIRLEIQWPSGETSQVTEFNPEQTLTIIEVP